MVLLIACSSSKRTTPLSDEELLPYQECVADADCQIYANGCGCDSAAIAVASRDQFDALFECETRPDCGIGADTAICDDGRCAVAP